MSSETRLSELREERASTKPRAVQLGVTGLSTKIAGGLMSLAGGNIVLGLVFTMISAIILGAGMPVTAVYIILAATLAQPLTMMGVAPIAAHFFIFMFSAVAGLTPPVAITSYTAAGIAGANLNRVGLEGFLFGLPGFIIPFMFAFSPALLMQGSLSLVLPAVVTAALGIVCLVAAIEGYLLGAWRPLERVLLFGAAIMSLIPETTTDIIGVLIILGAIALRVFVRRAVAPVEALEQLPQEGAETE